MIEIVFETKLHAHTMGVIDEQLYDVLLPYIEKYAKEHGYFVTERVVEE